MKRNRSQREDLEEASKFKRYLPRKANDREAQETERRRAQERLMWQAQRALLIRSW